MHWPPNIEGLLWFCEHAWPQVRARVPAARLTLIGKNPPDRILALDLRADVDVPGYVDDLAPYLAETAAFIIPLRAAGGMRVKILDAWAWGLPIVSTTIGAEGIATRTNGTIGAEGPHQEDTILLADTPDDFARATIRLLINADVRASLRTNGRQAVASHYDWRRIYSAWDHVYDNLLTPDPPS
jgi:glycosyltransferase involved in cell wall biosynthesis